MGLKALVANYNETTLYSVLAALRAAPVYKDSAFEPAYSEGRTWRWESVMREVGTEMRRRGLDMDWTPGTPRPLKLPLGATLLCKRAYSGNPGDKHLTVVLAVKPNGEFVTWLFNSDDGGCHCGHYYFGSAIALQDALNDFNKR